MHNGQPPDFDQSRSLQPGAIVLPARRWLIRNSSKIARSMHEPRIHDTQTVLAYWYRQNPDPWVWVFRHLLNATGVNATGVLLLASRTGVPSTEYPSTVVPRGGGELIYSSEGDSSLVVRSLVYLHSVTTA